MNRFTIDTLTTKRELESMSHVIERKRARMKVRAIKDEMKTAAHEAAERSEFFIGE
jgi:hypothetical protein